MNRLQLEQSFTGLARGGRANKRLGTRWMDLPETTCILLTTICCEFRGCLLIINSTILHTNGCARKR